MIYMLAKMTGMSCRCNSCSGDTGDKRAREDSMQALVTERPPPKGQPLTSQNEEFWTPPGAEGPKLRATPSGTPSRQELGFDGGW